MTRAPKANQTEEIERERPGEKNRACESLGATQQSPQRTKRLLGPCDPKQILATKRNHTGGGLSPSARAGHCTWGALPQDAGETTCCLAPCGIECRGGRLEVWSRKTGKTTDQKRANASTASRPKKASEQSRENPKNARGPEWHPAETPEQKRRTAKTGEQDKAVGTGKKKTTRAGGVWCPVSVEMCLFKAKTGE